TSWGHPGDCRQHRADASHLPWILTNDVLRKLADDKREPAIPATFIELGPAHHPVVGSDLQERKNSPTTVGVQVLDLDYLHVLPPVIRLAPQRPRASAPTFR